MTLTTVKDALSTLRTAQSDLDRAGSALDDAAFALSKLDPEHAARQSLEHSDEIDRLFRVARSVTSADGVFDLHDLQLATDAAEGAISAAQRGER